MNTAQKSQQFTTDLKQSLVLARKLASLIRPPFFIDLVGDLGGGKTTFTKALGKALGVQTTITSPTFNIHRGYDFPSGRLEHFDLYRLENDEIVLGEMIDCLNDPSTVVVVEWGQHFKKLAQLARLTLEFEYIDDNHRKITVSASGSTYETVLKELI